MPLFALRELRALRGSFGFQAERFPHPRGDGHKVRDRASARLQSNPWRAFLGFAHEAWQGAIAPRYAVKLG